MSHTNTDGKNPEYVARGLKATLHNDRVSEEAKEAAAHRLQEMSSLSPNQERGYKAALKNPHVSDDAKKHAQKVLEESRASY